ncbi:hypothetical protein VTK73DRAFT_1115 [Phialemonium thermophilum]|uniref:Mating-type switching protein swi10 n=1 Tax=Phialemonium thermophilum TaxID=223376 RepID=A0ABR3XBB5_9PEZI
MSLSQRKALVWSPLPTADVKAELPRSRRKLQKTGARHRHTPSGTFGNETPNEPPLKEENKSSTPNKVNKVLPCQDMGDSKWSDYLPRRHLLCTLDSPVQSQVALSVPHSPGVVPMWFRPEAKNDRACSHIDYGLSNPTFLPPSPSPSPPLTQTVQVESQTARPIVYFYDGNAPGRTLQRPSCTFLDTKQGSDGTGSLQKPRNATINGHIPNPSLSDGAQGGRDRVGSGWHRGRDVPVEGEIGSGGWGESTTAGSAGTRTNGGSTLVGFEDETVYFKPVSLFPEPLSPLNSLDSSEHVGDDDSSSCAAAPLGSQMPRPASLSLQICVDLLMRDLGSALTANRLRKASTASSSALQVWVMIEAYEHLRDRILDMRNDSDEIRSLELMFDLWLRVLCAIHDSLASDEDLYDDLLVVEDLD